MLTLELQEEITVHVNQHLKSQINFITILWTLRKIPVHKLIFNNLKQYCIILHFLQ